MKSKKSVAALRGAARMVDVPGSPRSLRLDDAHVIGSAGGRVVLTWSYSDPESGYGIVELVSGRIVGREPFDV